MAFPSEPSAVQVNLIELAIGGQGVCHIVTDGQIVDGRPRLILDGIEFFLPEVIIIDVLRGGYPKVFLVVGLQSCRFFVDADSG